MQRVHAISCTNHRKWRRQKQPWRTLCNQAFCILAPRQYLRAEQQRHGVAADNIIQHDQIACASPGPDQHIHHPRLSHNASAAA